MKALARYLSAQDLAGPGKAGVLRGTMRLSEPMAKHTSWRVGGPADRFYEPADIADLALFLQSVPAEEPVTFLGLGSNLLVRDGGLRGTVVCTSGVLGQMQRTGENTVWAESGVACAKIAKFCAKENLVGGEFFAGIPGTLGGALAMNAGAFGGETWTLVSRVETLDRRGERHRRSPNDYQVSYRHVEGHKGEWFIGAELKLAAGDGAASAARIKELLAKRNATQPTNLPNCGSVFRNPTGDHAARLIESAGLKGYCMGGACVSEKHANFIVNMGTASAQDIESLIAHVAQTVSAVHGVDLVREVHIIGELS